MFSILRQNCKLVKPTEKAHLKRGVAYLSYLSRQAASPSNCAPDPRVWKFPTKRVLWPRARLTKPREGAGPEEPPRGCEVNAQHRHRSGVALPMFPSMAIFLMRVPSELAEGEGQNLLGGVVMPARDGSGQGPAGVRRSWELGRQRQARAGGTRTLTLARGGWAGPSSGHALAAPTPTFHASASPAGGAGSVAPPGEPGAPGRGGQGRALRCQLVGGQGRGLHGESRGVGAGLSR